MIKRTILSAAAVLTLFACSGSDNDPITPSSNSSNNPSSSSSDSPTSSSSIAEDPSSSSSDDPTSSSSVAEDPISSSSEPPPSTCTASNPGGEDLLSIAYSGPCTGFNPSTQTQHLGKMKRQICDERDGTKYFYVPIGRQFWLAENLRYSAEGTMGRCFRDEQENCDELGLMYSFQEMFCKDADGCLAGRQGVVDPGKLDAEMACPYGWHLPTTGELEELFAHSDPDFVPGSEGSGQGRNSAATKLRAASWGNGTDEFGFAALPGGYCGDGCPQSNPNWYTLYAGQKGDPIRSTFWWHKGFGAPVPLTKSWHIKESSAAVDDAYQSYGTSRFYTRCVKNVSPQQSICPETPPAALACSGEGAARQKCYYGKWKSYFIDGRDGKEYPQVEIGGKTWMAANLNYAADGSKCYNGLEANCNIYGRLYNYATASNACPRGWHLPSNEEWTALTTAVGGIAGATAKLKAKSGWGQNGTDDYGFAALPGSYGVSSVLGFGTAKGGFWWSATTQAANGAVIRHIGPVSADVKSVDNDVSHLYSVRCLKN